MMLKISEDRTCLPAGTQGFQNAEGEEHRTSNKELRMQKEKNTEQMNLPAGRQARNTECRSMQKDPKNKQGFKSERADSFYRDEPRNDLRISNLPAGRQARNTECRRGRTQKIEQGFQIAEVHANNKNVLITNKDLRPKEYSPSEILNPCSFVRKSSRSAVPIAIGTNRGMI